MPVSTVGGQNRGQKKKETQRRFQRLVKISSKDAHRQEQRRRGTRDLSRREL